MSLFKKRKQKNESGLSASDKVAEKIANSILTIKKKFGDNMKKFFSKLTPGSVKIFLIVFCLSAGGYSLFLVADSILNDRKSSRSIHIDPVKTPKHFHQPGDESLRSDQYIDEVTYRNIIGFKMFMDSLKSHNAGAFDSILKARPGLMDSVLLLENIYHSQLK